jgi:hypothetical protein
MLKEDHDSHLKDVWKISNPLGHILIMLLWFNMTIDY